MSADSTHTDQGPSRFWDGWNQQWRFREDRDPFMRRQEQEAIAVARERHLHDARILDVGCGTGWLGDALRPFGRVWGTDLSPASIADGARRHPELTLVTGNFLSVELPGPFDFVISADALAHMPDYAAFFQRVAELVKPGGTLLLMTQNPSVWQRRSTIRHVPDYLPHAKPAGWPTRARIRQLIEPSFSIERVTTFDPGGDQGLLWWVENRYVRGAMRRVVGRTRWPALLERLGLGRELVIVARRKG
jgi:SAM-dependent methyltransferase